MATSMINRLGSCKPSTFCRLRGFYRTFLSDAYRCEKLWKQRLDTPILSRIDPRQYGIKLLEKFDKERQLSDIDIDIFANKLQDLKDEDSYITKDLLFKFRHCETSCPINDSIYHSVVRNMIESGQVELLIDMMKDKYQYGVFPDAQAMCMLLDHLIVKKDYFGAAQVAYEVMLQEESNHPIRNLLSLYAIIKHFKHTMNFERREPPAIDEEEEIDYVAVKIINNPYYDDHFNIKDERFLLGKSLYYFGKEISQLDKVFSRTLQLIGLGLYEKFELANQLLEKWISDDDIGLVVYEEAIQHYKVYLETAPVRDPDAPEKSMGEKTIDDEIEKLKLTQEEKGSFLLKLKGLLEILPDKQLSMDNIEQYIENFVWSEISKDEVKDIETLEQNYKKWSAERTEKLNEQLREYTVKNKMGEILEKLEALQEREELLSFFENEDLIKLHHRKRDFKEKETQKTEEEYVEAPGERNVKLKMKK